ncbi:MAG: ATP-binding protein [Beijerinckiaceae bacterium]
MTALGKLWRTTAFRVTLINLGVFVLFAIMAFGYFGWNARRIINNEIASTIDAEIKGLSEQYEQGGIRRLASAVEQRASQPGASLYLVTDFTGRRVAGNISALAPGVLDRPGSYETNYQATDEADRPRGRALVRVFVLQSGFRVVVGRDILERERLGAAARRTFAWTVMMIVVLGGLAGLLITKRVLRRVDAMTDATERIMAGNIGQRLPGSGSGDEFDRLATHLNTMLDRIGELMTGLQHVSDNIAHDLKTPLTRLRNRAEGALRLASSPDDYRRALEGCIEESDNLIRVFNALLTIARLESGQSQGGMTEFDAAGVIRDVGELYDPIAEEAGAKLAIHAPDNLPLRGSRELVGQALANLIDNAIKYGAPDSAKGAGEIAVSARRAAGGVEFIVADRGPGVPESERERVVKRFERLESARTRSGFGLGLSLASAVAKLHHGSLVLEDNQPGLRVRLTIPDAPAT